MALAPDTRQARVDEILDAAARLIRKRGDSNFTMRVLADEAGLSPATPFNLLGSKSGVFRALLRRSLSTLESAPSTHPIDRFFLSWELCAELYASDEVYFRALVIGSQIVPDAALLGMAIAESLLTEAVALGSLARNTPVRPFAENLDLMGVGILVLWSRGLLPSERLVAQYHHGMAVMLSTVVTDESRARVAKWLRSAERVLRALGPLGEADGSAAT
ncbi:MAG: TetR/AcrR family transcriptional regulator [Myxococcales bacterium]|nr:TetR/AcrR family transcriptional regulator [Myxococcales bacterium]